MFESERHAIREVFKLPRATMRESMILATIYAAQAITCTIILTVGYQRASAPGLGWAIISAIIVLQPGIQASLATSVSRILANVVGAIVAVAVEYFAGNGTGQLVVAITIIVFLCEALRLDMGLRAACVSAVIVMTFHETRIVMTSVDRSISVMIGSALAVIVQIAASRLRQWFIPPPDESASI
ncbi:MAG TPA: FUSC family protein [Tepidisphaeraceae bacterium]|jgi:uncharacterized membrane protein YgaE (UPF0421/DUF939 family)